ncbi:hypothetical protein D5086_005826 [Populus alba]|uniref:Uncharacterized protein n=1 Tax=Populus alba TaxID=43335 RepID=A0ACC4CVQ4_POPAL
MKEAIVSTIETSCLLPNPRCRGDERLKVDDANLLLLLAHGVEKMSLLERGTSIRNTIGRTVATGESVHG